MTKQELREYIKLEKALVCIEEEYEKLRAQIESPQLSRVTGLPRGNGPADWTEQLAKLVDLREQYRRQWDAVIDRRLQIEAALDGLDDPAEQTVMRYRYIDGLPWETVCKKMNYAWAQVHRIHKKALNKLKDDTQ